MTTLTGRWVWGPLSGIMSSPASATGYATWSLDDSDDAIRVRFTVPKDGTLAKIGIFIHAVTGNPPAYQAVFKDLAGSAYGGCSAQSIDFTSTGWHWVTLSTPATANAGDIIDAVLEPTGSAPDGSNCVSVRNNLITAPYLLPRWYTFSTAWTGGGAFGMGALYSDDSVAIPGVLTSTLSIDNDTTPDEIGASFTTPFACKCRGARFSADPVGASADFVVALMNAAGTVLGTTTIDATYENGSGLFEASWDEVSLAADTQYRISITPSSGDNVVVGILYCDSAASRQWFSEGPRWQLTERTDAGAWTETATAVPLMSLILSEITLPEAGGGGGSWAGGMVIG